MIISAGLTSKQLRGLNHSIKGSKLSCLHVTGGGVGPASQPAEPHRVSKTFLCRQASGPLHSHAQESLWGALRTLRSHPAAQASELQAPQALGVVGLPVWSGPSSSSSTLPCCLTFCPASPPCVVGGGGRPQWLCGMWWDSTEAQSWLPGLDPSSGLV